MKYLENMTMDELRAEFALEIGTEADDGVVRLLKATLSVAEAAYIRGYIKALRDQSRRQGGAI